MIEERCDIGISSSNFVMEFIDYNKLGVSLATFIPVRTEKDGNFAPIMGGVSSL